MKLLKKIWFVVQIDKMLLNKLDYIAQYDGKTRNEELEAMMKEWIRAFEDIFGEIDPKAPLCKGSWRA